MAQQELNFERPKNLGATFYFLRHATSVANEEGIIVSSMLNGISKFGLSEKGLQEIDLAASKIKDSPDFSNPDKIVIVTSPFKRTFETAQVVKLHLRVLDQKFYLDERIRERNFGAFELQSNEHYSEVWEKDFKNDYHKEFGVESVRSVYKRGSKLILEWAERYKDHIIIVIGHGDSLQITQCFMENVDPKNHRSLPHLNTAEFRKMGWVP